MATFSLKLGSLFRGWMGVNITYGFNSGGGDTMWKKGRRAGFILAEQLLALEMLVLVAGSLLFVLHQARQVRAQNEDRLLAARLAKEASDELVAGAKRVTKSRAGVRVVATRTRIQVSRGDRVLVTIGGR